MKKTIFGISLLCLVLSSCASPSKYQVNPTPDLPPKPQEVPESQQEGYMRILGDLRWDQLRTLDDWKSKLPGCFRESNSSDIYVRTKSYYPAVEKPYDPECRISVGGIEFYLAAVILSGDNVAVDNRQTEEIIVRVPLRDQSRAFIAAISQKYNTAGNNICSKYTCFKEANNGDPDGWGGLGFETIIPTDRTKSIIDNVQVDSSEL